MSNIVYVKKWAGYKVQILNCFGLLNVRGKASEWVMGLFEERTPGSNPSMDFRKNMNVNCNGPVLEINLYTSEVDCP